MYKLFLALVLLVFVGCEPTSNVKSKFALGEKVILFQGTPAMVVYKSQVYYSGEETFRYEVKYVDSYGNIRSDWFYEFELEKAD